MFGFGAGKIELKLPKTLYAAGETIEGTLLLTVSKPVKARGLFVTLSAEQQIREPVRNRGKTEMNTVTRKIYNYQQQLDTEREYGQTSVPAAYPFSVILPPMAQAAQDVTDPLHGFAISWGGLHIEGGPGPVSPAKWTLEGYLDLPLAIDVKASVSIGVAGGEMTFPWSGGFVLLARSAVWGGTPRYAQSQLVSIVTRTAVKRGRA